MDPVTTVAEPALGGREQEKLAAPGVEAPRLVRAPGVEVAMEPEEAVVTGWEVEGAGVRVDRAVVGVQVMDREEAEAEAAMVEAMEMEVAMAGCIA